MALLPLIGGSGGGGGAGSDFGGSGGGGGGGAILIAASGTITLKGSIYANGGNSGTSAGINPGATGGGGSGGAIRLVATTLAGNGIIRAKGGSAGSASNSRYRGGRGADGYIKLESENITRTSTTDPTFTFTGPKDVFVAGMPTVRITSVAGIDAPAVPTGNADIVVAEDTANPVTVQFATTNVPVGNTVTLKLLPAAGAATTAISDALAGSDANATASASINLPDGPSVLSAEVTYTVTIAQSHQYRPYADGELVASVRVNADSVHGAQTTFITHSGAAHTWPANRVALQ